MTCGAGLLRGEFCHNDEDDNADDNADDNDDDDDDDDDDGRVVTGRVLPTQTRVTQLSQELQQDEGRRGEHHGNNDNDNDDDDDDDDDAR